MRRQHSRSPSTQLHSPLRSSHYPRSAPPRRKLLGQLKEEMRRWVGCALLLSASGYRFLFTTYYLVGDLELFAQDSSSSRSLSAWGVGLAGLICVGDKLSRTTASSLEANSLVFKMHQYYFVASNSLLNGPVALWRRIGVPNITVESGKPSYDR